MNILAAKLDDRAEQAERAAHQEARDVGSLLAGFGIDAAERKLHFDSWARRKIRELVVLPSDPKRAAKLTGQIEAMLETMFCKMWSRSWLVDDDGKRLRPHVEAVLHEIGDAQRRPSHPVTDLYPFAKHVIETYAGAHAEELQADSSRRSIWTQALGQAKQRMTAQQPGLVTIAAHHRDETVKAKLAAARRKREQAAADAKQARLF